MHTPPRISLHTPLRTSAHASPADIAACKTLLRENSKTFFAASRLLPSRMREPAFALYAFCRLADDAVDLGDAKSNAVIELRERLDQAYRGRPMDFAADRAFADVVVAHNIPRTLPEALIEGFEWDANNRQYENLSELYSYAARVAGTVGAMMTILMGVRSELAAARACDLGVAMQLTNIARDVGEDARAGRLYLPRDWMREAGIDADQWLLKPQFTPALAHVVERLLNAAEALYARVDAGVAALPASYRPGINAARFLYAEIGNEIARAGFDSVSRRAVVSNIKKARLIGRAFFTTTSTHQESVPPIDECRFLVDAVSKSATVQPNAFNPV